jgi:hypothetical protein
MSSKRRVTRNACRLKKPYDAFGAGIAALKARARTGEPIYPYKCLFCSNYHIGHNPLAAKRPMYFTPKKRKEASTDE